VSVYAMSKAHLGAAVDRGYSDMERRRHGGSVSERERGSQSPRVLQVGDRNHD
jgi:hypothetical protein